MIGDEAEVVAGGDDAHLETHLIINDARWDDYKPLKKVERVMGIEPT